MEECQAIERKQRRDAELNKQKILASACNLFTERGIDVSVNEIAKDANIGVGTIYRNYPAKSDLFEAAKQTFQLQFITNAQQYLNVEGDWEAFSGLIHYILINNFSNKGTFDAFQNGLCEFFDPEGDLLDLQNILEILLNRVQLKQLVRSDLDIHILMAILSGLIMMSAQLDKNKSKDSEILEMAIKVFERGIAFNSLDFKRSR
ncbi:TetR/AcrR family transcriptional regulator [Lactovum miscens]|uniref:AcrR family transcriptional regulator n=1 Tax=Lactovum miscens TaxID=190387 RepID=A0A841C6M3_9LACT|nr:TetR/AcrR family transcriptional regulator [Lactovum miscens]MBB5887927.1 AcrR family transcriptional regulator [Lactovum miscens]